MSGVTGLSVARNNTDYNKSIKAKETLNPELVNNKHLIEHKKVSDSANLSNSSKNTKVIEPVDLCDEVSIAEKASKTYANCIGGIQTATTVVEGASNINSGAKGIVTFAKVVSPVAKTLASMKAYSKVSAIVNSPIVNKSVGVFGVVGGGFDIYNGVKQIQKGHNRDGGFKIAGGVTGVACGVALIAGAPVVAGVAGTVGLAVGITKYGDDSVKKLGWIKGHDGKAQSSFEHLGEKATDIANSVEKKTGSKIIGTISKYGSGVVMVPGATAVAVSGAVVQSGKAVGGFVSKGWNWALGK